MKEYEDSRGEYIDVHRWYYTPDSFTQIVLGLNQLESLIINHGISLVGDLNEVDLIKNLLNRLKISQQFNRYDIKFSAGTMLWYRPNALKPLFDLGLTLNDFPPEPIGVGGTMAHAIERLPSFIAEIQQFETKIYTKYT